MDVHSVRQMMRTKSIYEIPIRVTFYARVSSEKDEQLNSLDNQISYYRNFIKKNANWEFVEGYIDEGLSGMSTKKRENFHNMISDAKAGLFDLVITKEITRFARCLRLPPHQCSQITFVVGFASGCARVKGGSTRCVLASGSNKLHQSGDFGQSFPKYI